MSSTALMGKEERLAEVRAAADRIPDRILHAAAVLMERVGFDRASMRDIADLSEVSKPGLYYHVDSKEILLFAIHLRFADWLLEKAEAILVMEATAEQKLRSLIELGFNAIAQYKAEVAVYLHERFHLGGDLREAIDSERLRYRDICEEILSSGVESGEFSPGELRLDTLVVMGAVNWAYVWFDPDSRKTDKQIAKAFADRLLLGLKQRTR